jgi:low molecular weight phosphotyrosine protein phosphatase
MHIKPKNSEAIVKLLGSYDPKAKSKEDMIVEDPYYGGQSGFARNFDDA